METLEEKRKTKVLRQSEMTDKYQDWKSLVKAEDALTKWLGSHSCYHWPYSMSFTFNVVGSPT